MPRPLILALIVLLLFPQTTIYIVSDSSTSQAWDSPVYGTDLAETVYRDVSVESYLGFVRNLSEMGPRSIHDDNNVIVRDWIISKLENLSEGRLEIEIWGHWESIVARLPGSAGSDAPSFLVGGHYDTVPEAPGANDDGSGVAAALELARVLSKYNWTTDIYFVFWNAEEYGLLGSRECAPLFFEDEIDIAMYFNIDMLLVQDYNAPLDERVIFFYSADYVTPLQSSVFTIYQDAQYWAELTRAMGNNYDSPVIRPLPHTGREVWKHSDHYAFWTEGYKGAIFAFESSTNDPAYHTPDDTWDNPLYDYNLATSVVASIGSAIAYAQGRTLGQSRLDKYSLIIGPHSTQTRLFPMTLRSNISLTATTNDGDDLEFQVFDTLHSLLAVSEPGLTSMNDLEVLYVETDRIGQHEVTVTNNGDDAVEVEIVISYEADVEGDSIPDSEQDWYNRFHVDSDSDLIPDAVEMSLNTNRFNNDSDFDSVDDYSEIYIYGSYPFSSDSDGDNMPDPWEIQYDLDPMDRDDMLLDPDSDMLTNIEEYREGTHPRCNDTDLDSVSDGMEVEVYNTNPLSSDTDMDLMPDRFEIDNGLDPTRDDSAEDLDGDGVSNLDEYLAGTDPNSPVNTSSRQTDLEFVVVGIGSISLVALVTALVWRRWS